MPWLLTRPLGAYIDCRLPLIERLAGRSRPLGRDHLAVHNCLRRPEPGRSTRAQYAGPDRLHVDAALDPRIRQLPRVEASQIPRYWTRIHERVARNQSHTVVHPLVHVGDVRDVASGCRRVVTRVTFTTVLVTLTRST